MSDNEEEEPEYGDVLTDPVYSNDPIAEYCEIDEIEDDYDPPRNSETNIKSQSDETTRRKPRRDVADIYDEDHYAIADVKGCVTKQAGAPKLPNGEKQTKRSSSNHSTPTPRLP